MRRQGPKPSDMIEQEIAAERREILRDLLESRGWVEVVRPALQARAERIARQLATDAARPLEELRVLQGQYRALLGVASLSIEDAQILFEG